MLMRRMTICLPGRWTTLSTQSFFTQTSLQGKKKKLSSWQYELEALYGPKLNPKQVKKVIASTNQQFAALNLYDTIRENNEKAAQASQKYLSHNPTQRTGTETLEPESVEHSYNINDDSKRLLDKLLMFPMFVPTVDSHFQVEEFTDLPHKDIIAGPLKGYVPSVSKVINETMSPETRFFLERWEKEMIEKLGEEGFRQYKKGLEQTFQPYYQFVLSVCIYSNRNLRGWGVGIGCHSEYYVWEEARH